MRRQKTGDESPKRVQYIHYLQTPAFSEISKFALYNSLPVASFVISHNQASIGSKESPKRARTLTISERKNSGNFEISLSPARLPGVPRLREYKARNCHGVEQARVEV